jgi:3-hydroxybutyryl-CoA dehydrogenase
MDKIKNILICGAGLMGKNIAYVMAGKPEYIVTLYDSKDQDPREGIRKSTRELVEKGIITSDEVEDRLKRVHFTTDLDHQAVKNADIVIEAVFEDIEVKRELFKNLEERCSAKTIFCTNSSVMSPSDISRNLKYRGRFVGTHFWNPAHLIPLVEIIKSDATTDDVAQTMMDIFQSVGKKPVLCKKDVPGFIANRMQHALWREAIYIVEEGIADAKTVDDAVKYSFGLRLPQLAPLENADMVGLDLTYNIHKTVLNDLCDSHEPSPLLAKLKDEGKLGFKSGEGFQKWSKDEQEKLYSDLNKYLIKMIYDK